MIKRLDREFLISTADALWVGYPWEWIDSFNEIYQAMVTEAIDNLWLWTEAKYDIIWKIYYNYIDTSVDLSVEDFLKVYPEYIKHKEELENILY